jgi:hypothetical protein
LKHPFSRWVLAGTAAVLVSAALTSPAYAATGVSLLAGAPQELSAAVGDNVDVTLSVTNTGSTALDGVAVYFGTNYGFEATGQFANCTYDTGQPRACTFGETLQPGTSYRFVMPYRVRSDTYAPGGLNGQFSWLTTAELARQTGLGTAGSGATLQLQEGEKLGESSAGGWQSVDVKVTGTNGADLTAIGDSVSGAVGDVVDAEVGVHNNGPATLDWTMTGSSPGYVLVTPPAGTSVVSSPGCSLADDKRHYECDTANQFRAGATKTWIFTLKITQVVSGGAAGVVAVNPACQCQRFDADLDKSNDKALLVVNPSADGPDLTAPMIDDPGIVRDQLVPAVLNFRPTVMDNVGVTKLEAFINGQIPVGCTLPDGVAACRALLGNLTNDKDATITLRASDAAGNRSEVSVRVHVDNVAPTGTLSPVAGSSVRSGPVSVTVAGLADDTAKVVMLDGSSQVELAARTEAPWTFSWNAVNNAVAPWFVITDRAGNSTTRAAGYLVDDEAPVVQRVDFAGSYSTNRLDTGTGWVGAVSTLRPAIQDESRIARAEWWVNGVLKSTDETFAWDARAFTPATATVELRVWDAAGNTAKKSFRVNIDKAAPAMTVSPAERKLVRGKTFASSLKVSDPHGVAYTALEKPVYAGSKTAVQLSAGTDGAKTLTWLAIDKLGNYAYVKRTVIVDNTVPALQVTKAPKSNAKLSKNVTLTASASDRNGVAKVQMLVNGKAVATDSKAGYSFTLNPKKYGKQFTVQLRAYDKAGNIKYSAKQTYRR